MVTKMESKNMKTKINKIFISLFILICCSFTTTLSGRKFNLLNGSYIIGKMVKIYDGVVSIDTGYGIVTLKESAISKIDNNYQSDNPFKKTASTSRKLESWYTSWMTGMMTTPHVDSFASVEKNAPAMNMEGIRIHFPLNKHWLLGFGSSLSMMLTTEPGMYYQTEILYMFYLHTISIHFFPSQIGDGFFFRGDLGLTQTTISFSGESETSNMALGFLIGAGYAQPLSDETSLLFQLSYKYRTMSFTYGSDYFDSINFEIGFLW